MSTTYECPCGKQVNNHIERHKQNCEMRKTILTHAQIIESFLVMTGGRYPTVSEKRFDNEYYDRMEKLVSKSIRELPAELASLETCFHPETTKHGSEGSLELAESNEELEKWLIDPPSLVMKLVRHTRSIRTNQNFVLMQHDGCKILVNTSSGNKIIEGSKTKEFYFVYINDLIDKFNGLLVCRNIHAPKIWELYCIQVSSNTDNIVDTLQKSIINFLQTSGN